MLEKAVEQFLKLWVAHRVQCVSGDKDTIGKVVPVCPVRRVDQLLEHWLNEPPNDELLQAWRDYVSALKQSMKPASFTSLKQDITKRSQQVASAAGGILGIGKISKAEQAVLDDVEATFN